MNQSHKYLMDGPYEVERLHQKTDRSTVLSQLLLTGFGKLPRKPKIVDAGCGSGIISDVMSKQLSKQNKVGLITLIDISKDRLNKSVEFLQKRRNKNNFEFLNSTLENVALPAGSQDYVFSRFVFEYLQDPQRAFSELLRITKRGGKLVIGDLDGNCLIHYGLPLELELQLNEIGRELTQKKLLDPWLGRKIYSFFYDEGLKDIRVHFQAHHLFYGKLSNIHLQNWSAKLNQILKYHVEGRLKFSFNINQFRRQFLSFMTSERRFSYTPLIIVEGKKK